MTTAAASPTRSPEGRGGRRQRFEQSAFVASLILPFAAEPWLGLPCALRGTVGLDCPLCGGTRAVGALVDGRLTDALDQNAVVVLGALALLALVVPGARRASARLARLPGMLGWSMALAVTWAAVRNLPFVPYLSSGLGA